MSIQKIDIKINTQCLLCKTTSECLRNQAYTGRFTQQMSDFLWQFLKLGSTYTCQPFKCPALHEQHSSPMIVGHQTNA
jgi:hypothetical protein